MRDADYEKQQLQDFYYYMLYFDGDTQEYFTTRNRPPCRTRADIEVSRLEDGSKIMNTITLPVPVSNDFSKYLYHITMKISINKINFF